jgi:hypothetical protein
MKVSVRQEKNSDLHSLYMISVIYRRGIAR